MAGRERLGARLALSLLPRWVAVLGIALVLAMLTGIAALLGMGTTGLGVRLGLTRTVTVVLKVDGVPWYRFQPPPICNGHGGPCDFPADTGTVTYTTPAGSTTYQYAGLPSTRKVRVPVGGAVTLDVSSGVDVVGCSVLLNGKVLSNAGPPDASNPAPYRATCRAVTPSVQKRPTSAPRPVIRKVTVRVGGLSPGDTLDYEAPAVSAFITHTPYQTFTKDLWVRSGSFVNIHASSRHDPVACSIAVDGQLLIRRAASPWDGGLSALCQAKIPSGSAP